MNKLYTDAVSLLKRLIAIESFSTQEDKTADVLADFFSERGIITKRKLNNVWAFNKYYDPRLPTILLNSHHDTVKPNSAWVRDPFQAIEDEGKLYGLGSNDAGGCLVSLMAAFIRFYAQDNLTHNVVFAATAEEEISGTNGIESIFNELGPIAFAVVGEPTQMHLAIAERGLIVLDCIARGRAGHAAREEGTNAIYAALKDIEWFSTFTFPKVSEYLGAVKMNTTVIGGGTQHNVIPAQCGYTVDVRVTDAYSNEEILETIKRHIQSEVYPRSLRLRSSCIDPEHPIVKAGVALGRKTFGSPTTSDQTLIPVPSLKIGPGDSKRSHTADEFIYLYEIEEGIKLYIELLERVVLENEGTAEVTSDLLQAAEF